MAHKREKLRQLLLEEAGTFVNEASNRTSLLTVTDVRISEDKKHANILFTVLPEEREETAQKFLARKAKDFQEYLTRHTKLRHIPRITFILDEGEKHRQHIEDLSQNI